MAVGENEVMRVSQGKGAEGERHTAVSSLPMVGALEFCWIRAQNGEAHVSVFLSTYIATE